MDKNLKSTSKFISLVLRHQPEEIGLDLDENGWADVNELLAKMNAKGTHITLDMLHEIVNTNDKKRFAFNETGDKIRANQGHSIEVDVERKAVIAPDVLYHGTAEKNVQAIMNAGLNKMQRQHVHLSADTGIAVSVGQRHGKPIILSVNAKQMQADGHIFYLSENNVWLTDAIGPQYLSIHKP